MAKRRVRIGIYDEPKSASEYFTSGCALLDCVLGKGWPVGKISNIVGDKSTGKTLLAIEACANFARKYPEGVIKYVETEAAFDKSYAASVGLPDGRVEFPNDVESGSDVPISTIEVLFANMEEWLKKAAAPMLIVVDSWDALSDENEMTRDMNKGTYGQEKAKKLSQMMRRLVQKLKQKKCAFIIVSQVRDNIGVTFGKKHTRSGGKALDFYSSIVLWLAHIKRIELTRRKAKRAVGVRIRCKTEKNKCGPPFRECDVPLYFSYGIDDIEAVFDWFNENGLDSEDLVGFQDYKHFKKESDDLSAAAYRKRRAEIAKVVRIEWRRIEQLFTPTRSKYGE